MHEMGIATQLLALVIHYAEQAGAKQVKRLNLVIGEFSSVVDESLQFYWEIIAKDSIAEHAELHFERIAGRLRCLDCGSCFGMSEYDGQGCPKCHSFNATIADGDQFRLESIEIEEGN
jgi:hydrogenase nickel incorporation protein HypA/HybF